jgi:hypothetical protein
MLLLGVLVLFLITSAQVYIYATSPSPITLANLVFCSLLTAYVVIGALIRA